MNEEDVLRELAEKIELIDFSLAAPEIPISEETKIADQKEPIAADREGVEYPEISGMQIPEPSEPPAISGVVVSGQQSSSPLQQDPPSVPFDQPDMGSPKISTSGMPSFASQPQADVGDQPDYGDGDQQVFKEMLAELKEIVRLLKDKGGESQPKQFRSFMQRSSEPLSSESSSMPTIMRRHQ